LARQLEADTVKDEECLRYEWYRSETPGTYILIERWTDEIATRDYLTMDHITWKKFVECVATTTWLTRLASE
jgi:quinol monooxygenase YgiN